MLFSFLSLLGFLYDAICVPSINRVPELALIISLIMHRCMQSVQKLALSQVHHPWLIFHHCGGKGIQYGPIKVASSILTKSWLPLPLVKI